MKMNPTNVAKQQRQQETEALREEVTRLREHLRSLKDAGPLALQDDPHTGSPGLGLSLPPSQEVLGKTHRDTHRHTQTHTEQ